MKTIIALVLGLVSATSALRAEEPGGYTATGKLVCGMSAGKLSELCVMSPEFYGTQIEILQSAELQKRTLERTRALNPDLKELEVQIKVSRVKDTSILDVVAMGAEARFTRIYLDALLDEFMALLAQINEKSMDGALNRLIADVLAREKDVKAKGAALLKARANKASTPESMLATLEFEFTQAREDYQDWKKALDRLDPRALVNRPIVILERPMAAVKAGP